MSEDFICPFCESEKATMYIADKEGMGYFIECSDCYASGPIAKTREEAVDVWNRTFVRL